MISLSVIDDLVTSYIAAKSVNVAIALQHNLAEIPNYSKSGNSHPLCDQARKDIIIGRSCKKFYSEIQEGKSEKICPMGFKVQYLKILIGERLIGLFTLIDFQAEMFGEQLKTLPRKSKKQATECMLKPHSINREESDQLFSLCSNIINTLLFGRVGASLRGLSHHILTPIQGVIADIESIDTISSETHDRIRRNITEIYTTSKKIQMLLAEQSEFNKASIRRMCLHAEVNKIINQLSSEASKSRIQFDHRFNDIAESIEVIPDQIYVVLQNLLQNAVKYSHVGFPDKPNLIIISYKESPERKGIHITISNLGCGITESEINSGEIFELGFRGTLSLDRGRQGCGCGLYTSNLIIRAHGGEILINSKLLNHNISKTNAYKTDVTIILPITQDT